MSHKSAETIVKHAVANTHATVRKQRNRRPVFKAWTVSKLLETYKDPRAILLEIASTPTKALAEQMNGSLADAIAERRLCAQAVLPYVAQRLPAQIDMRMTRAINLNIVDERAYQELVEVAASEEQPDDGSFSMQLLPTAQPAEAPQPPAQPQERALSWDITPSKDGSQRKNVTSLDGVSPPVEQLAPEREWWDGKRTQPMPDKPAERDRWQRTDSGTWAPKPK